MRSFREPTILATSDIRETRVGIVCVVIVLTALAGSAFCIVFGSALLVPSSDEWWTTWGRTEAITTPADGSR